MVNSVFVIVLLDTMNTMRFSSYHHRFPKPAGAKSLKIVQLGFYLERVVIRRILLHRFEWLLYFLGGGFIFKGSNVQDILLSAHFVLF